MTRHWQLSTAAMLALAFCIGAATAPGAELTVRNHSVVDKIYADKYKLESGAPAAVEVAGARNGTFAAQLVVASAAPIKGLKASASDLKGPGVIPARAVEIRYALPDGPSRRRGRLGPFDSLEAVPRAAVAIDAKAKVATQPVWVKVHIPADAKPGSYTGTVTVSAEGAPAVVVPVKVRVIDWTLPDANKYFVHMDFVQSPESVAMAYNVELWSKEHFALLDKTFALLKPLAAKTIYVSAIRRTHFGNEHAMVRWVRDAKGEIQPNFDIMDKYLAVATKHLGKVPGVIMYCWEPVESMGHAGGTGGARRTTDKPIQYTLWDPKRNKLRKRTGPAWGTPEAKAFWGKFNKGLVPVLKKHGLEKSLLYGLIGDARPTKQAMNDIVTGMKGAKWAVHSHHYCSNWQGHPVGMAIALWGIHLNIADPSQGHGYSWQSDFWLMYYPRELALTSSLPELRYKLGMWLGAFSLFELKHKKTTTRTTRGLGRLGADFWVVLKDGRGRVRYSLPGRYPESYWGQLNLNYCVPYVLGKGKNGPLPTVRSEAFREGVQESEARVFLERAIEIKANRAKVGEELAKRVRVLLDERIRMLNRAGGARKDQVINGKKIKFGSTVDLDWQAKNARLFETAAEVAKKLGQ
jgi:glycosyl hydrolase family 123